MRILLVEDDAADARLLRAGLEGSGLAFELVHVDRLAAAREILASGGVDVVLLDLTLPDGGGTCLVAQTIEAAPAIPVVVLTGRADERAALDAVQAGAQDYLVKGRVDPELLVRSMRYAIERKRAQEGAERLLREQGAREQAEASAGQWRFLAEASRVLASSLDYETTLKSLARLAVADLADYCFVDLLEDGRLVRVALAHADATLEPLLERARPFPVPRDRTANPAVSALESGRPVHVAIDHAVRASFVQSPEHEDVMAALGARELLCAPLVARGRTLGVMLFADCGGGRLAAGPRRDLAEELVARAALAVDNASLHQQAQRAGRSRDELIDIVTHDLRNPLNVITMMLAALQRDPGQPVERLRQRLGAMQRSADRMTQLIQDLLDATRIEGRGLHLYREPTEIGPLVEEVCAAIRQEAGSRIAVEAEVAADAPALALDRSRIRQVFVHLLGNALRHTGDGGTIAVRVERAGDGLACAVADTGSGIDPAELPHLFDRFWQGRRARGGGAGLGLPIARGVIEAHGGRMQVESTPGRGTTFRFSLPAS